MERKIFKADNIQISDAGAISFRFAKLGVIDKQGDIIMPNAIENGKSVLLSSWNHSSWGQALPVGKGTIAEENGYLIFRGMFNLATTPGRENYETVKFNGDLQEYSFGFDTLDREISTDEATGDTVRKLLKMDVHETSPVLQGAGIDTGTNSIKSDGEHEEKSAIPPHKTTTTDGAWNGPANERRLSIDKNYAYYRLAYAWVATNADRTKKTNYRFIHHEVSSDGTPGAANTRACSAGIAVLNGGRGGASIPSADRQGVYNHLAKHLRDAGKEPPPLKSLDGSESKTYADHAEMVYGDVLDFVERSQSIASLRVDEGKEAVSQKNREGLKAIAAGLTESAGALMRLADEKSDDQPTADAETAALFEQIEVNELMRSL